MYVYALTLNKLRLISDNMGNFEPSKFIIRNGSRLLSVRESIFNRSHIEIIISGSLDIKSEAVLSFDNNNIKIGYNYYYGTEEFNKKFSFDGELGLTYSKKESVFKLWSPAASSVKVLIYKDGDAETTEKPYKIPLTEKNNLWSTKIDGDLEGHFYTYEIEIHNSVNEAVDPYAKAVGINGLRGAIIDMSKTNPPDYDNYIIPKNKNITDAIIYEISIRDISKHPDSGVNQKGLFQGLCEEDSKSSKQISTVLSHIKELGVTHVQILPFFDFSYVSVNEKKPEKYNWGYDPQNYNAPEGSFSTNPYDPYCRIIELKKMIQCLHNHNICINMDVVYNHVYFMPKDNFQKIFPDYYFRTREDGSYSDGSGCGNDVASERKMVRKFILDSVLYWASEYHINGFRFDLMGLLDIDTMNLIKDSLDHIYGNVMVYGEGWDLGTTLAGEFKTAKYNAYKTPHISYFNDGIRDCVKGQVFNIYERGFVSGKGGLENEIRKAVVGSIHYTDEIWGPFVNPEQSVNYVSCHDNSALWDKFERSNGDYSIEEKKSMVKLANAIIFTSQGVPFFDAGVEFCRTKCHVENSYNAPDYINWVDWNRKSEYYDVFTYFKGLIKVRKEHPAFRMNSFEAVKANLDFINNNPGNTVCFVLKGNANDDPWKNIVVAFNANRYPVEINIPINTWFIVANGQRSGTDIFDMVQGNKFLAEPLSCYIMYSN